MLVGYCMAADIPPPVCRHPSQDAANSTISSQLGVARHVLLTARIPRPDQAITAGARLNLRLHPTKSITQARKSGEVYAPGAAAGDDDIEPCPSADSDWAVDVGHEMRALSTLDLWIALSTGELPPSVRVWMVGREGWEPAWQVPQLACAVHLKRQNFPVVDDGELIEGQRTPHGQE